jgi:hypothetical protein
MALADAMQDVSYRACYCSVFDQCWMSSLKGGCIRDPSASVRRAW